MGPERQVCIGGRRGSSDLLIFSIKNTGDLCGGGFSQAENPEDIKIVFVVENLGGKR